MFNKNDIIPYFPPIPVLWILCAVDSASGNLHHNVYNSAEQLFNGITGSNLLGRSQEFVTIVHSNGTVIVGRPELESTLSVNGVKIYTKK